MLPRSLRLMREGFSHYSGLKRTGTPHFSISYGLVPSDGGSAVIVPKKVIASAVARHQMKRRLRALLRPWSAKDRVIIVSVRKGAGELSFADIEHELSDALAGILGTSLK